MYAKNRHRKELAGVAEFIVIKQRNGPVGTIPMWFKHSTQEFFESTKEESAA
jgi:replicative DNA helicase